MENEEFFPTITINRCLMWVYSDYTHTTYFCFLSGVSITYIKGRKCTSLYPFQSKEYSTEEKLFGLDLEIAVSWPLFVLANTLFVAIIFRLMEVKSVHFKKKNLKSLTLFIIFFSWGESFKQTIYGLANNQIFRLAKGI